MYKGTKVQQVQKYFKVRARRKKRKSYQQVINTFSTFLEKIMQKNTLEREIKGDKFNSTWKQIFVLESGLELVGYNNNKGWTEGNDKVEELRKWIGRVLPKYLDQLVIGYYHVNYPYDEQRTEVELFLKVTRKGADFYWENIQNSSKIPNPTRNFRLESMLSELYEYHQKALSFDKEVALLKNKEGNLAEIIRKYSPQKVTKRPAEVQRSLFHYDTEKISTIHALIDYGNSLHEKYGYPWDRVRAWADIFADKLKKEGKMPENDTTFTFLNTDSPVLPQNTKEINSTIVALSQNFKLT